MKANAVNPEDWKVRLYIPPTEGETKVIDWDAIGEVIATGNEVTNLG